MSGPAYPVRVDADLQPDLSRWLWLVKWFLLIPHYVVLVFLWTAYFVLSLVALLAIVVSGRYPRSIFAFNVGVLRWTWRVTYYAYGGLGTDRYPPFSLDDRADYPAHLEVAYPEHLSRGLALVKWWLLAIPHYLVIGFFVGGGWAVGSGRAELGAGIERGGLIGVLVLVAAVLLLVTGRYPQSVFDLVLGLNRWVIRVAAYASLMTDVYPPFRLDLGGVDPGGGALLVAPGPEPTSPSSRPRWGAGRVVLVVSSCVVVALSGTLMLVGLVLDVAHHGLRDNDGYLSTSGIEVASPGFAVVTPDARIRNDASVVDLPQRLIGTVRIEATSEGSEVFVGIADRDDVAAYLGSVSHSTVRDLHGEDGAPRYEETAGGAPLSPPDAQDFWIDSSEGPGRQVLTLEASEGERTAVVMNADATAPVESTVEVGATLPMLDEVAYTLCGVGVFLLAVSFLGLWLGLRRPDSRA